MKLKFSTVKDSITKRLNTMVSNTKDPTGFLNREVYRMYQQAQIKRWDTENASEGRRWKRLTSTYRLRKLKQFAAYPYAGTKMLVATGTLLQSVVGTDKTYHRKLVNRDGLVIQTTLNYARYVAEERPFMAFSDRTVKTWKKAILTYIKG